MSTQQRIELIRDLIELLKLDTEYQKTHAEGLLSVSHIEDIKDTLHRVISTGTF